MWPEPWRIDTALDARAITFENPTGSRGAGGTVAGGRKGAPSRGLEPGERVVLADVEGPGIVRHIWMTFPPAPPETMRAMVLEVFYDGAEEPSISAPCLDLFGLPHGRPVPCASMLTTAQEGRGFNSYIPMPFAGRLRVELVNAAPSPTVLYHQIDLTLEDVEPSYLHASSDARTRPRCGRTSSSRKACAGRAASSVAWSAFAPSTTASGTGRARSRSSATGTQTCRRSAAPGSRTTWGRPGGWAPITPPSPGRRWTRRRRADPPGLRAG